ncbi:ComEC/Rec2 family competence protein [uncultured Sunxiuqinia sp.]|uniref:ComEC/Rec2 family competence protein n=1 Tax=uncultured Sunxiuqinia sp. TaxID=1573825 RepID=UPI002615E8E5|nr:ComEC/Rec2 family competence protein [uncultured Sunxiuqinia sp.]
MTFFTNNPFTRILSFWLIGLLIGNYFPPFKLGLWALLFVSALFCLLKLKTKTYPFDLYLSSLLAISLVTFSSYTVPPPKITAPDQHQHILATLLEFPTEKPNSYQAKLKIHRADSAAYHNETILAYFEKTDSVNQLQPGDQLVAKCRLQAIRNQGTPYGFDYQKFMANRQIYYSTYISARNYIRIQKGNSKSLLLQAEHLRSTMINLLRSYIKNKESLQVISALTLGYRKELSPETRSYFASTGAMHVLAVSGLHVGMIYLFLSSLLGFLKRSRFGRLFYVLAIGLLLWFYALLTGFSPSVQRATVMFSFILIGSSLQRPAAIYNSIAASAFILLLFNPNLLFEVGFQLSYAAVTSIVFFFPRLESLAKPRHKLTKKLWQLFCVSLAAQLGTFALSIYYFNQFPVYFWLSNFLVIPAAYLILGGTFLFFIFSPISYLAEILASLVSTITFATTFLLRQIEQLPFSLIENISLSSPQLLLLLTMGGCLLFFIKLKRKAFFFTSVILLGGFFLAGFFQKLQTFNQQKFIVYADNNDIHLINGRTNYLIQTSNETPNQQNLQPVINALNLEPPILIHLDSCKQYQSDDLIIDEALIVFIDQTFHYHKRNVNQSNKMFKQRTKQGMLPNNTSPIWDTKIDSVLVKEETLNLANLKVRQALVADLKPSNR